MTYRLQRCGAIVAACTCSRRVSTARAWDIGVVWFIASSHCENMYVDVRLGELWYLTKRKGMSIADARLRFSMY